MPAFAVLTDLVWDYHVDEARGGLIEPVQAAAQVDQRIELLGADADAGRDRRHAFHVGLEVPDEFLAGGLLGDLAAVLQEDRDPRETHDRSEEHTSELQSR